MNIKIAFIFNIDSLNKRLSLCIIRLLQMTLFHAKEYDIVFVNRFFIDRIDDSISSIWLKPLALCNI